MLLGFLIELGQMFLICGTAVIFTLYFFRGEYDN